MTTKNGKLEDMYQRERPEVKNVFAELKQISHSKVWQIL